MERRLRGDSRHDAVATKLTIDSPATASEYTPPTARFNDRLPS
ncbi:hypothetical protein [Cryobacterium sp. TMT1-21]|nr:hypothetical protein [Cryobacterium sp. TMT1-21]